MANATFVIHCIILFESLLIFSGNSFNIFVFWKNRSKLKRTSFLLINLAVADLLVGLSQMIITGGFYIPDSFQTNITSREDNLKHSFPGGYQVSLPFASVFFLVLISLERAYALIWPLRHRVASIRGYIYSAIFVWGAAIALQIGNLLMLFFYYSEIDHWMIAVWSIAALSLIVICACYVAIRAKLSSSRLVSVASKDNSLEQNKKLSRTLFIVIGASLVCWGSSSVAHFIFHQCSGCFSKHVLYSFYIFHLANSLVNPVIYSFRFPMFRETLREILSLKTSERLRFKQNRASELVTVDDKFIETGVYVQEGIVKSWLFFVRTFPSS